MDDSENFVEEVAKVVEEMVRQEREQKRQALRSAHWYPKFLNDESWKELQLKDKKEILSKIFPGLKEISDFVDPDILLKRLRDVSSEIRMKTMRPSNPEVHVKIPDSQFTRDIPVCFYRYPEISCVIDPDDLYRHMGQIKDIQEELSEEARIRLFFRHSEYTSWKKTLIQMRYERYIEGYDPEKELRCKLIDCSLRVAAGKEKSEALFFMACDMFSYAVRNVRDIEQYARLFFPKCLIHGESYFCEMMWYIEDYHEARAIRCTKNRNIDCRRCYEKLKYASLLRLWSVLDIHPTLYRYHDDGSRELMETHPAALFFRIAGWFNQYQNVLHHLFCRSCHSPMAFNLKYCTAYYNAINLQTVAECENPYCLDYHKKVYLSTCWNCHGIIDSLRNHENDFSKRDDGFWYCNSCGAGSKEHKHEIGDICPKCLASLRDVSWIGNKKRCPRCKHVIHKRY